MGHKTRNKKFLSALFFCTLVLGGFLVSTPKAIAVGVPCAELNVVIKDPTKVQIQGPEIEKPSKDAAKKAKKQCIKEYFLDNFAWVAANVAIQSISSSVVDWINNGFDGSPAFVQNLKGHFNDLANATFEDMLKIFDIEDFVCSSFSARLKNSFNIQLAINTGRFGKTAEENQFFKKAQCTIDSALKNIGSTADAFKNDFSQGGWPAWLLTINDSNNEIGAKIMWEEELWRRQNEAATYDSKELGFGNGFMSWKKKCGEYDTPDKKEPNYYDADGGFGGTPDQYDNDNVFGGNCMDPDEGKIQTPGSVIEDRLNKSLGLAEGRLQVADELNEIVSALFSQLSQQVLSKGLAGISGRSSSQQSYTDQVRNDQPNLNETATALRTSITNDMPALDSYIATVQTSVGIVENSFALLRQLLACYQTSGNSAGATRTQMDITNLTVQKDTVQRKLAEAQADRLVLQAFLNQNTTGTSENLTAVTTAYTNISTKYDQESAEQEQSALLSAASTRNSQTQNDLRACRNNP